MSKTVAMHETPHISTTFFSTPMIIDNGSERYGPREQDIDSDFGADEEQGLRMEEFEIVDSPADDTIRPRFLQGHQPESRFQRTKQSIANWIKGPVPAQIQVIKPWFPALQEAPLSLLDRFAPKRKHRIVALFIFYTSWAIIFSVLVAKAHSGPEIEGFGSAQPISCTETLWKSKNECGLDGVDCKPFTNSSFAFRCPANCASVQVWNPHPVGGQDINYRPLVIGDGVYRGDSFICGSAIHGGLVSDATGGCGIIARVGEHSQFASVDRNGIESIAFDSHFPLAFEFQDVGCKTSDGRWPLLFVSLGFTIILSLFSASPAVLFSSTFTGIFAHVGLVSDPPSIMNLAELISNLVGKFLPAAFCALAIYLYCLRLEGTRAQIEKTVLWLGGCWFGGLSNYTLDWIPISRLTAHDIKEQPGAKLALAIIIILLISILSQQVYYFRLEGRLRRYLGFYALIAVAILSLVAFSSLKLRLHHYIFSLLLLPGTSLQTRPSLLYQGLLIGLFINGIARWGFDPVLQSDNILRGGDGQFGSLLPAVPTPDISLDSTISFNLNFPSPVPKFMDEQFNGISVLVNDVERFRTYLDDEDHVFVWGPQRSEKEYFRFGYLNGEKAFDYTRPGIWQDGGGWVPGDAGEG